MAYVICDDHNFSVEADDVDVAEARKLMFADSKPGASKDEQEIIEFGKHHRECNIRIIAG
jgi:hypothetical protein